MKVAFYAPLKSPDSPTPSGDRLIARMLWSALEAGGHDVRLASRLRSFDRHGDAGRQQRVAHIGQWAAQRLCRRYEVEAQRPDIWLTYHLYHKAPDWLGPLVTRTLGIPYCVAEASYSTRQADGPWRIGHRAVADALAAAQLVVSINPKDEPGVRPRVGPNTQLASIQPFIDGTTLQAARANRQSHRAELARHFGLDSNVPWLVAIGMMREGDKAESYALLSAALAQLADRPWQLIVIGDGVAASKITEGYQAFGTRVRFVGQQDAASVARILASADLLVWPAINEAIGMVFIEAAMAGVAVVGADRPGIAAIVDHGATGLLVPEHDMSAFAAAVARLLDDETLRSTMGHAGAARAATRNSLETAGRLFCGQLEALVE